MKTAVSRARLQEILNTFQGLKIAILGDFALDAYWYVDMAKAQLSRETPLFNRPVAKETYSLGGTANVAWNLADLGIKNVSAFSVFGDDWRAKLLRDLMTKAGIKLDGCITSPKWSTVLFAKIFLTAEGRQQEDARLDFINEKPLPPEVEASLLRQLEACFPGLDALVISDYQPVGVISHTMLSNLNSLAQKFSRTLIVVDSRDRIGQYRNMVLKPNRFEAARAVGRSGHVNQARDDDLNQVGKLLQAQANKPVFITLGEDGCLIIESQSVVHQPGIKVHPPIDTVGAGDSFLASLAASLAAGASNSEAAFIACLASAVTIRKLNITGTATPAEILGFFDDTEMGIME
jgi:rfaE bifunctional protein kinase chain/domain